MKKLTDSRGRSRSRMAAIHNRFKVLSSWLASVVQSQHDQTSGRSNRKAQTLSDERQDRIAALLLHLAEDEPEFDLSEEQIEGIELALRQADAGEFANEEEIERALHKPWG